MKSASLQCAGDSIASQTASDDGSASQKTPGSEAVTSAASQIAAAVNAAGECLEHVNIDVKGDLCW